mmetsp:Transcript_51121/g.119727  ORF Transcript_51121/g.119727 Transcript_51121/m.119727 type:complete len:1720 (-) Transcript_51121:39-5198(-)
MAVPMATDHELFVGDIIDQMRRDRQEKTERYRSLPYFEHLGSEDVFSALDKVRQAHLQQTQLKMQKDCSYLQHMDDASMEGRNAESVRKRVQEGKLHGGFRQIQNQGQTVVCGCLDCQMRLCNKQHCSSFSYEQARDALVKKAQQSKLTFSGAAWHRRLMLTMHLAAEALDDMGHLGTALHVAVLRGEVELVKFLCTRSECNVSAAWGGVTALDLAIAKGFEETGDVLLQNFGQLKHFSRHTLIEAVERNSPLLLRALLAQAGQQEMTPEEEREFVNAAGEDGNTPLHLACSRSGREAILKILIFAGAKPNLENSNGATPLDCCVQENNSTAWRVLRSAASQAKCRRFEAAQRCLEVAITSNCLFLVQHVHLRQESDGCSRSEKPDKRVAQAVDLGDMLHLAVRTPHINEDIVRKLLEYGADVNTLKDGFTVLDACLQANQLPSEDVLGRQARLERYQDYTLMRASEENLPGLARYLVNNNKKTSKDAMTNKQKGLMPLHIAGKLGHDAVVKVLLEAKCNVHDQTSQGASALDLACEAFSRFLASSETSIEVRGYSNTIVNLHARGCKLKVWKSEEPLKRAKEVSMRLRSEEESALLQSPAKEDFEAVLRKQQKKRREECDEVVRQVEREVRACVAEEEKKADAYKESEKLARRVAEARQVLQANLYGEGEMVSESQSSSKFYQIRIDVLRRKMVEKESQIEEALRKVECAEEDYIWNLRKRMRDLRLKYHPDKITDRQVTDEDYKFYDKLTKAYDVVCSRDERDKYLEISNHVAWLKHHGEEEEARLVEKAMHGAEPPKKPKAADRTDDGAQGTKAHVERAKKKLQERREEETYDKPSGQLRALTLGIPNKCKAPVVTAQRFSQEQGYIDVEWVCKCSTTSAERVEYELHAQVIDKEKSGWTEVYHGWEDSAREVGPFQVGTYEFMVRARNSMGWGEWSDVAVVRLEDPKAEKQWKKEAEHHVMKEQGKNLQTALQELLDEVHELRDGNKLTIHRASNLLFQLHMELKRARPMRSVMPKPSVLKDAEDCVKELERWRDRKETFAEWRSSMQEMKTRLLRDAAELPDDRADSDGSGTDLIGFLTQEVDYFGSLPPQIRNLVVQTLLGFDAKQVFKKLVVGQKEAVVTALRRGVEIGRASMPAAGDSLHEPAKERGRTIFTKLQTDQLQKLADRFGAARCAAPSRSSEQEPATGGAPDDEQLQEAVEATSSDEGDAADAEDAPPVEELLPDDPTPSSPSRPAKGTVHPADGGSTFGTTSKVNDKRLRTLYISNLPTKKAVARQELINAIRPFAEVDAVRMGQGDALIRFTQPSEAKAALAALEEGRVSLWQSLFSGDWASTDVLTDEALQRAGGRLGEQARAGAPDDSGVPATLSNSVPPKQLPVQDRIDPQAPPPPPKQPTLQQAKTSPPVAAGVCQHQPAAPSRPASAGQVVLTSKTTSFDAEANPPPRIRFDQLVNLEADSSTALFKCLLCNGVAWHPKLTLCCQKVFCSHCLDNHLVSSTACPHCHIPLAVRDGSTGSSVEQRIRKLDRNSDNVHAVLFRVYGGLRLRCEHLCGWVGEMMNYEDHLVSCPSAGVAMRRSTAYDHPVSTANSQRGNAIAEDKVSTGLGGYPTAQGSQNERCLAASARLQPIGQTTSQAHVPPPPPPPPRPNPDGLTVVKFSYEATDPSQLTVQPGENVYVRQREPSGWTFVVKANWQGAGKCEGWVPDWLLHNQSKQ